MSARAVRDVLSFALAACLVVQFQSQNLARGAVSWLERHDFFSTYTPYFPGFANLQTHEIFAHANAGKKKIVLLGASAVDSIGCDYTWHKPEPNQDRNVHSSCSVAGQMNRLLREQNLGDWRAFDLARNGAKLTDMLYVYAQIAALKPDIVVLGETFDYYRRENAGASGLAPAQFATMDAAYGEDPETRDVWNAYKGTLQAHGWQQQPAEPIAAPPAPLPAASLKDVLARGFVLLRHASWAEGMPRPVAYTTFRDWTEHEIADHAFDNPDPAFGYFQGFRLIDLKQQEFGGKTFFYFSPQWDWSHDPSYIAGLDRVFGGYLQEHGIPYASYVGMRMQPITETYDGNHQTVAGNHRIAVALVQDLRKAGLIP